MNESNKSIPSRDTFHVGTNDDDTLLSVILLFVLAIEYSIYDGWGLVILHSCGLIDYDIVVVAPFLCFVVVVIAVGSLFIALPALPVVVSLQSSLYQ